MLLKAITLRGAKRITASCVETGQNGVGNLKLTFLSTMIGVEEAGKPNKRRNNQDQQGDQDERRNT